MDDEISDFMLLASKLEFSLVNSYPHFAKLEGEKRLVVGVNWDIVGQKLEESQPFHDFDFPSSGFQIFRETVPQRLVARDTFGLKWDSEAVEVTSWRVLLWRGYAQLRNNVAHGNKAHLAAPFTRGRTREFLEAGRQLISFIAIELSLDEAWDSAIVFS